MSWPAPRIYGVETEYGLTAQSRPLDGGPWQRLASDEAATRLFAPVVARFASTNVFLPNGGRLYLDVGNHPEYATPECTSVADLLVAERAGDELVAHLAREASELEASVGQETSFRLVKNNVDSFGNSYGSHENYLVARDVDPAQLTAWLVPFLASRQAIAGAGRWHRGSFTIGQRSDALGDVVSNQTTRARPLINTRDEPHADPSRHRRLHVISGDSNLDEPSAWLRYASTELVLRLAESGRPAPITLEDPLAALRAFGRDPEGARALQRRYAEVAAAASVADGLEDAVDAWLEGTVTPEWEVKRGLLQAYRDRHALGSDDPRLDALDLRWHVLGDGPDGRPLGLARLLQQRGELTRLTDDAQVTAALDVAPGPGRARLRGRLLDAAQRHGRDYVADWSSFTVHDLPQRLALDDPFVTDSPEVEALIARMASEPARRIGGFLPPPPEVLGPTR